MSFSSGSTRKIKIVFAYCSQTRQDKNLRDKLEDHLSGLKNLNILMNWCKYPIDTSQSVDNNNQNFSLLSTADVVALLINPKIISLIQDTPSLHTEIQRILQRREREKIIVVPLLIRQIHGWQRVLDNLAPLPENEIAVNSWTDTDAAFINIVQGLEKIIEDLKQYQQKLQEYRHHFSTVIQGEYPLNPETIANLNKIKLNLELKNKDIELIEGEITTKVAEEYSKNIQFYKQEFFKKIQWSNILSEPSRQILKTIQHNLGLKDEVVAKIEKEVAEQISAQPIRRLIGYGSQSTPKVSTIVIIIGVVTFLGFCHASPEAQVNNFLKLGEDKLEKQDYQGASEDYTKAIQIAPSSVDAYIKRGYAHYLLKDYQAAIDDYTKAIQIVPSSVDAYIKRGYVHYLLKDYQAAIDDYTKAIKIAPNSADAYIKRGHAHYFLKDYQAAIDDYTKAIKIAPNSADAYNNRAAAYLKLRNTQQAIKDYHKVATIYRKQGAKDDLKKVLNRLQKLK